MRWRLSYLSPKNVLVHLPLVNTMGEVHMDAIAYISRWFGKKGKKAGEGDGDVGLQLFTPART